MKRVIKFINLSIIAIFLSFGCTSLVHAKCSDNTYCAETRYHPNGIIYNTGYNANGGIIENGPQETKITRKLVTKPGPSFESLNIYYHRKQENHSSATFHVYTYEDKSVALYCMDSNLEGFDDLYAMRRLMDPNSRNKYILTYDHIMMNVLLNGNSDLYTNYIQNNISPTYARYFSTNLALRAITALFGYGRDRDLKEEIYFDRSFQRAIYGTINDWYNSDAEIQAAIKELNEKFKDNADTSKFSEFLKENNGDFGYFRKPDGKAEYYFKDASTTGDKFPVSEAKAIFKQALIDGIDYYEKELENYDFNNYQSSIQDIDKRERLTTDAQNNTIIRRVHTYRFTGFDENSTLYLREIAMNGAHDGVTFQINNVEFNGNKMAYDDIKDKELIAEFAGQVPSTFEIKVDITAEGSSDLPCHQSYGYTVTFDADNGVEPLENPYKDYAAIIWYAGVGDTGSQRYISIEPNANTSSSGGPNQNQRPFSYDLEFNPDCDEPEDEVPDPDFTCADLRIRCTETKDWNSIACDELRAANCGCDVTEAECTITKDPTVCNEYKAKCTSTCNPRLDNTYDCCDNKEGYLYFNDEKTINLIGVNNGVQKCFVNKIDNICNNYNGDCTNASVKDDKGNSYTKESNKYCAISCSEDYELKMPTGKAINAGRYFTLKVGVKGTKTCYTNTINTTQFKNDMNDLQANLINAINEYNRYKAAFEAFNNPSNITETPGTYTFDCDCNGLTNSTYPGATMSINFTYNELRVATADVTFGSIAETAEGSITASIKFSKERQLNSHNNNLTCTWSSRRYCKQKTTSSVCNNGTLSEECSVAEVDGACPEGKMVKYCTYEYYPDGICSGSVVYGENSYTYDAHQSCSYDTVGPELSIDEFKAEINGKLNNARSALDDAIKKVNDAISAYQECTTGWNMDYNYSPTVKYNYSEKGYMDLLKKKFPNMDNMKELQKLNSNTSKEYCTGSEADCFSSTNNNAWNDLGNTSKMKYLKCYSLSYNCSVEEIDITTADYVKQTSSVEATYVPKTIFYNTYPTGEITTDETVPNTTPVADGDIGGLPVSRSAARGIYFYTITINNLGEFSNGQLGRYYGDSQSAYFKDSSGNLATYKCSYLVNIPYDEGNVKIKCSALDKVPDEPDKPDTPPDNPPGTPDKPGDPGTPCKECEADCIGEGCGNDTCSGITCIAACIGVGCIYDEENGISVFQRTVSLGNLFPQGTESLNWTNEKGIATTGLIQDQSDEIYNETPILSIRLTPEVGRKIREYNNSVGNNYQNQTLICTNFTGYTDKKYSRTVCYSEFITNLLDGDFNGTKVDVSGQITNNNYRNANNPVNGYKGEYFEKWTGTIDETKMMGPSWK